VYRGVTIYRATIYRNTKMQKKKNAWIVPPKLKLLCKKVLVSVLHWSIYNVDYYV